ncbi:MAG TPA: hypothetical protein PKA63_03580 [Oligoflexia bacterium]|nr:hypothetical protein [Oligoflexia bacterium]HMP47735.1 hypothetical protein [Oligoflexia bacterium]
MAEQGRDLGKRFIRADVPNGEVEIGVSGRSGNGNDSLISSNEYKLDQMHLRLKVKPDNGLKFGAYPGSPDQSFSSDMFLPDVTSIRQLTPLDSVLTSLGLSELRLFVKNDGANAGIWAKGQDGTLHELSQSESGKYFKYSISGSSTLEEFFKAITGDRMNLDSLSAIFDPAKGKVHFSPEASFQAGNDVSVGFSGNRLSSVQYRHTESAVFNDLPGINEMRFDRFAGSDGGLITNVKFSDFGSLFFDTGSDRGNLLGYSLSRESPGLFTNFDIGYGNKRLDDSPSAILERIPVGLTIRGEKGAWDISVVFEGSAERIKGSENPSEEKWKGGASFLFKLGR